MLQGSGSALIDQFLAPANTERALLSCFYCSTEAESRKDAWQNEALPDCIAGTRNQNPPGSAIFLIDLPLESRAFLLGAFALVNATTAKQITNQRSKVKRP